MVASKQYRFLVKLSGCSLIFLALSCASSFSGQLVDKDESPVFHKDARVNIIGLEKTTEPLNTVLTPDSNGRFDADQDIPEGEYLIEALVPGYGVKSVRLKLPTKSVTLKLSKIEELNRGKAMIHSNLTVPSARGEGQASLTPPKL